MEEVGEKSPDCETDGYSSHWICTNENCSYTVNKNIIPALGHSYTSSFVTEPTCSESGYTMYLCACGDEYKSNEIASLGHDLITLEGVEATCTNHGITAGEYCTRCEYKMEQKETPLLEHDMIILKGVEPTCTDNGLTEGEYCSKCDYRKEQASIDPLGHTEKIDPAIAPDCVNTGLTEGKHCSVCNEVIIAQTLINALGHKEGEIIVENSILPNCVNNGSYDNVIYCTVCSDELAKESVEVRALGHSEVVDEAVEPTCTEMGLTEGKHCSVCGVVTLKQEPVFAKGHSYKETIVIATCTDAGYMEYVCSCGDAYVVEGESALGHKWVDATCTSPKSCSICNLEEGSILEHQYIDGECVCGKTEDVKPLENVTLQFEASKKNRVSFTSEQQIWSLGGLSFINDKANSDNDVADYASPVRCYAGSRITVEGKGLKTIVFVCYSEKYAAALKNSISNENCTVTVATNVLTVKFTDEVDCFVIESLSAQVRINSIKVNGD